MPPVRNVVVGNWKMNTDVASGVALASAIAEGAGDRAGANIVLAPPFVSLAAVRDAVRGSGITVAAQNMHFDASGAFTGEVSPPMLQSLCDYVIIGHSERRQYFGETDESVGWKTAAAVAHRLAPNCMRGRNPGRKGNGPGHRGDTPAGFRRPG